MALAAGFAGALILFNGLNWLAVVAAVAGCVALLWLRRYPVIVFAAIAPAFIASILWHLDSSMNLLFITWIALYGVPAFAPRRKANIVGISVLVMAIGVLVAMAPITQGRSQGGIGLAAALVLGYVASAWFLGRYHNSRRDQITAIAAQAVAEERARIARELHDMLAHTMSGMVVLAGGGRRVAQTDPQAAAEVLARIEEVGRQGMTDTRQLLSSIREAPTLDDLSTLVDRVRETGLPVQVSTSGRPTPVPAKIGVAAYRIVQESLTNVLRHAGPATAHVGLHYGPGALEVEVRDDGHSTASVPGYGLTGMRERAALAGGSFEAGPQAEGGWTVRAVFPA
jgi:signal transduction histidine kinase